MVLRRRQGAPILAPAEHPYRAADGDAGATDDADADDDFEDFDRKVGARARADEPGDDPAPLT
jgi:hypothetical protein